MTQLSFLGIDADGRATTVGQRILYFFRCRGRGIKIGITNNLPRRTRQLQTGNPDVLEFLGSIVVTDDRDEKRLHELFAPFYLRGEWFSDTPECLAAIDRLLHAPTVECTVGPARTGTKIVFMFRCPHCHDGLGSDVRDKSIDILVNCIACHKPIHVRVTVDYALEPGFWNPDSIFRRA